MKRVNRQSAPACSIPPLGHQSGDLQPSGQAHRVEREVTSERELRRLPVISRSVHANCATVTYARDTSPAVSAGARLDRITAHALLMMRSGTDTSIAPGLEVRLRRLSATGTQTPAVPSRSILGVSSTRRCNFSDAARRHANIQRRRRQGLPLSVSFQSEPVVHTFDVRPGNRLHGLPQGAIRSTKRLFHASMAQGQCNGCVNWSSK